MTSISSISAYSHASAATPPARVDPDHDGDNDAGKSKAAEAAESNHGPATKVTLSPAAQALLKSAQG